ncbi:pimeloyl-ACP methyl ester carboxylesterase [Tamaricihabitans halophyticus]|uniref:Pimeloyl-ACP methyl ester carboxylesterase n=1 Tax=Tamaricihabitans halophyticus TaxID=1262583 RepID=A0A4R2R4R7_9PSEU|nr:alpha/beta hydrolase [Tamaricihabitans halophyticus]TCP56708.1 pimeloyl-ACP methyl ester carboxylesterase [Tamaricihabitans halophyticus]
MRNLVDFGGSGRPILLLHGLMGRARTWWSVAQWLTDYGHVVALDARAHGRNPIRTAASTEEFAEDAATAIRALGSEPAVVIGHSMGGLHAWVLAALYPELVHAVVVEDMAPDQVGKTVDGWRAHVGSWPVPFASLAHVRKYFGPAGDYFAECVEEREDGYHLIAPAEQMFEIAAEWGTRSYWSFVDKVSCPLLAIEAEHTAMPAGQIAELAERVPDGQYVRVPGAGHLVHEDAPEHYRGAVSAFLSRVLDN